MWSKIFSMNWAIHLNVVHPLPSQHVDHLRRFGEDFGFWHIQRAQRQEHQDVLCRYGGLDGPRGHTEWTRFGEGGYLVGVTSLSNCRNLYRFLLWFPSSAIKSRYLQPSAVQSTGSRFQKIYSLLHTISHYMKFYRPSAESDGLSCVKPWFSSMRSRSLVSLSLSHPASLHRSSPCILKGVMANLIIDLPDAAVLRRGWNNLLSLQRVWHRASSALAKMWK